MNHDADFSATYGAFNETVAQLGSGGRLGGVWSYGSRNKLNAKYGGLVEYWDDVAKAPYLYNATTGAFFSYDNEQSIAEKAAYVQSHDLGGMIAWMASNDAVTTTPGKRDALTKAMKQGLFGSASLPQYHIGEAAVDVSVTVESYGGGYDITLTNNATADESTAVLAFVETAAETVKLPKLYIKTTSGATFASGGYGAGTVTNQNGYGVVDLSTVYDHKMLGQGSSITFKLQVTGTVDVSDIESIELAQHIVQNGTEISRQAVSVNAVGGSGPDTGGAGTGSEDPDTGEEDPDTGGEDPDTTEENTYSSTAVYWGGDIVSYNGNTYRAKWWTLGEVPGASLVWELIQ